MKHLVIAMALLASMSVSGCTSNSGDWTPWGAGRTAGDAEMAVSTYEAPSSAQADSSFDNSLRK